jgi:Uma2 family endonuclease
MVQVMATDHPSYEPFSNRSNQPGEPPWDVARLFPLQGSWTEDDYLELGTNHLVEFSDGCIEVLSIPTKAHQRIVRMLFLLLQRFVSTKARGEVFFAPLPVRLWPGKFREPDIVYVRPGRAEYAGQPEGADLVVEVVSGGQENRRRDVEVKPQEYAKAGVSEYWIVDPQEETISVLVLERGAYRRHGVFGIGEVANSTVLPGFVAPVKDVFAAAETSGDA